MNTPVPEARWASRLMAVVARRFVLLGLTVLAAALLSATLMRMAPGYGMNERQLDLRLHQNSIAAVAGGNRPPGEATGWYPYLRGLARGEWGQSISLHRPVRELIVERSGLTVRTMAGGLALAWLAAMGTSLALVWRNRRMLDRAATVITGGLMCLPTAIVALAFLYLAASPALALATVLFPRIFRYTANILKAASRSPHVLAAQARGIGPGGLLWRHVCLPAGPELLALAGVSVNLAVGAVIPVEALCDSPGVGQLVWQSALARDLPVLLDLTVLVALVTCAANSVSDAARCLLPQEAGCAAPLG